MDDQQNALWPWAKRNLLGQDKEHSPTRRIQTITASDNVNPLSQLVVVTGTTTATLETAVGADNRWHVLVNSGTGTMTIACTGSETIGGKSSIATEIQYATVIVWSDGTNWQYMMSDREEGTWTPSFTFATPGNLALTAETKEAYYTKQGKNVLVGLFYSFTPTFTTAVGAASITGLPFPSVNTTNALRYRGGITHNAIVTYPAGCTTVNLCSGDLSTSINIIGVGSGTAAANLTIANFTSASATSLGGSLMYQADV